ncbi:NADPH-dependent ferric siderophore reductase, contains FAD-binding and SIP domains [Gilliamella bombicola]|uniref:NADPH-dependent ferric siderophore reductase, contains FAD-binding and SIP domains n=1 Tax=Gilliamella bombicola TaxID=1798182 RepID=A0A1C4CWT3_9GAMM|nr:siderophore-interacting protein [Gilliamella bombicola]SCC23521.1 NADPH-dependent ferric siderophore reductase, contains FAD-binding and SIP domains [Gilliamella bombicola]
MDKKEQKIKIDKKVIVNALLTVLSIEKISPSFIRVQFSSNKPINVNPLWICPYLKLLFPDPLTGEIIFPKLDNNNKIVIGDKVRQLVRSYSVREFDRITNQFFVDFAIHDSGLASVWSQNAKIGDQIGLIGAASKLQFTDDCLVLVGDISSVPAICYTLEHLPKKQKAFAFIQVNDKNDIVPLVDGENIEVNWFVQDESNPHQLVDGVMSADLSEHDKLLFWGGMECSLARLVRQAVKEKYSHLSPDAFHITSYWREGFAEGEFKHRE